MKIILLIFSILLLGLIAEAQIKVFASGEKGLTTFRGDTILIDADTALILRVIEKIVIEQAVLTRDLGGKASTTDVGTEVVRKVISQ
ncbi:MAG: hypothetical protein O2887_06725 [Bacteroidetes bacterium]|nr:hypothetical protein [Bacteroidota bacterium]MDA1120175.1 hypothetical protein [Bacteroidota bacterium]